MSAHHLTKLTRTARRAAPLLAALWLSVPVAAEALVYTTTFQGATFTVTQNSSTDLTFEIAGANALTGDWAGVDFLGAFAFNNIGASGATLTATLIDPATNQFATSTGGGGLSASAGCSDNGNFFCFNFEPNIAVASVLKFDISATGGTFDIASTGPDLKILWTNDATGDTNKVGSLFSASIPVGNGVIPEPATWAMMILGFGGVGALMRRRRSLAPAFG